MNAEQAGIHKKAGMKSATNVNTETAEGAENVGVSTN